MEELIKVLKMKDITQNGIMVFDMIKWDSQTGEMSKYLE
jgi:hypothetical protein